MSTRSHSSHAPPHAFVHLHQSDTTIGSHHHPLPRHMSAPIRRKPSKHKGRHDQLRHRQSGNRKHLRPPRLPVRGPNTPRHHPLRHSCPDRMDPRTLRHRQQRPGRYKTCCQRYLLGYFPLVLLAPAATDPLLAPPGVAGLAQAKKSLSLVPLHEAISHLRSPSTPSYSSNSDAAICFLPPRTRALPAMRGGSRSHRPRSAALPRSSICYVRHD